jgi:hypothetical protein
LSLEGSDAYSSWSDKIDESNISYDIEIFDNHRLVYDAEQVPDPEHTLGFELEACKTYRWSVRPAYHVGDEVRFGEWMRFDPDSAADSKAENKTKKGIYGSDASEAPAYIQDFAILDIECGRR